MTLVALTMVTTIGACDNKPAATPGPSADSSQAAVELPASLFVKTPPQDAAHVRQARGDAVAGQSVLVRGRIGGSKEPFVDGRAVFTMVDSRVKTCAENPDDGCPTPWDYCCEPQDELAESAMSVQIVDAGGRPLKAGVNGTGGLAPMAEVIVSGKLAKQSDPDHTVINAESIYVASAN